VNFLKFIFSNFWIWLGFFILLGLSYDFFIKIYDKTSRHKRIMKHGYPPAHCDVDGDFKEKEIEEE